MKILIKLFNKLKIKFKKIKIMHNLEDIKKEFQESLDKFTAMREWASNEEEFSKLTTIEKNLISSQLNILQQYLTTLEMRIELGSFRESKNGKKKVD